MIFSGTNPPLDVSANSQKTLKNLSLLPFANSRVIHFAGVQCQRRFERSRKRQCNDACGEQTGGGKREGVEKSTAEYCRSYFSPSTSTPRFRVSRQQPRGTSGAGTKRACQLFAASTLHAYFQSRFITLHRVTSHGRVRVRLHVSCARKSVHEAPREYPRCGGQRHRTADSTAPDEAWRCREFADSIFVRIAIPTTGRSMRPAGSISRISAFYGKLEIKARVYPSNLQPFQSDNAKMLLSAESSISLVVSMTFPVMNMNR